MQILLSYTLMCNSLLLVLQLFSSSAHLSALSGGGGEGGKVGMFLFNPDRTIVAKCKTNY